MRASNITLNNATLFQVIAYKLFFLQVILSIARTFFFFSQKYRGPFVTIS